MPPLFTLVDCNNFYASCERVFRPDLIGKPVAVLNNNDGCIVARTARIMWNCPAKDLLSLKSEQIMHDLHAGF